jgi:hypothetical protein
MQKLGEYIVKICTIYMSYSNIIVLMLLNYKTWPLTKEQQPSEDGGLAHHLRTDDGKCTITYGLILTRCLALLNFTGPNPP